MSNSKRFLQPLNLLNATSDPVSATAGDFYFNTTLDRIRFFNGLEWETVGSPIVTWGDLKNASEQ